MIKKDKLYLITGGTGVVGQALCSRILYLGGRVRVMSRSIDKLLKLQEKYKSIEIQEGDVTNNNNLANNNWLFSKPASKGVGSVDGGGVKIWSILPTPIAAYILLYAS